MGMSGVTQLNNIIPALWSGKWYNELRKEAKLAASVERAYEGELAFGKTVYVNSISAPAAEDLVSDLCGFTTSSLTTTQNSISVTKRIVASVEISDLAKLQSIDYMDELQKALLYSLAVKLDDAIIAAISPSTSAPDHVITSAASTLAVADLGTLRRLLSAQGVSAAGRQLHLGTQYYSDILALTSITSKDFVPGYNGMEGVVDKYMGFQIIENARLDTTSASMGFAFHPSFMQLVMQKEPTIQISNNHVNGYFSHIISADLVYGLSQFDNKRVVKITAS